jgi:small neutral amino acid transporter SnatA (MarC family)
MGQAALVLRVAASVTAQQKAETYHRIHVAACAALFIFAIAGLVGHYRLRSQYEAEQYVHPN